MPQRSIPCIPVRSALHVQGVFAQQGVYVGCTHQIEVPRQGVLEAGGRPPELQGCLRRQAGLPPQEGNEPPYHLGKCIAWDFDGPVVKRHHPEWAGWQPLKRRDKPEGGPA